MKCQHHTMPMPLEGNICCEACCQPRPKEYFSKEARIIWSQSTSDCRVVLCLSCEGKKVETSAKGVARIRCNGCAEEQPLYSFVERHLMECREKDTVAQELLCARCFIRSHKLPNDRVALTCYICKKGKHIRDFTSVSIRRWLHKDRHNNIAACYDCHYPPCAMPECDKRPEHAIVWNSWVTKSDFVAQSGCGMAVDDIYGAETKRWFCGKCKYPPMLQEDSSRLFANTRCPPKNPIPNMDLQTVSAFGGVLQRVQPCVLGRPKLRHAIA